MKTDKTDSAKSCNSLEYAPTASVFLTDSDVPSLHLYVWSGATIAELGARVLASALLAYTSTKSQIGRATRVANMLISSSPVDRGEPVKRSVRLGTILGPGKVCGDESFVLQVVLSDGGPRFYLSVEPDYDRTRYTALAFANVVNDERAAVGLPTLRFDLNQLGARHIEEIS